MVPLSPRELCIEGSRKSLTQHLYSLTLAGGVAWALGEGELEEQGLWPNGIRGWLL